MSLKKFKYKEVRNFLPDKKYREIYKTIKDIDNFLWTLGEETVSADLRQAQLPYYKNIREHVLFVHTLYNIEFKNPANSESLPMVHTVCDHFLKTFNFKKMDVMRSKVNLQIQVKDFKPHQHNTPHIDYTEDVPHYVLLYYLNESDGDTFFFNKDHSVMKRIAPEPNKLVFFNGSIEHASSHPSNHKYRIAMNTDFQL